MRSNIEKSNYQVFEIDDRSNELGRTFCLKLLELYIQERRWLHANPSVYQELKDVVEEYIVRTKALKDFEKTLWECVKNKEKKVFLFLGNKGAGKTSKINYFVNTQTGKLNEENYSWIRIDLTKVYRILFGRRRRERKEIKKELIRYLSAQTLYVYTKYGITGVDRVLASVGEEEFLEKLPKKALRGWGYIKKGILEDPKFYDSIFSKPINWRYVVEAHNVVIELLRRKGKKIILLIDGIDNIDYSLISTELKEGIEDFIEEIVHWIHEEKEEKMSYEKLFVFLRKDSLKLFKLPQVLSNYGIYEEISLPEESFVEVLSGIKKTLEEKKEGSNLKEKAFRGLLDSILDTNRRIYGMGKGCSSFVIALMNNKLQEVYEKIRESCYDVCYKSKCFFPQNVKFKRDVKERFRTEFGEETARFLLYLRDLVEKLPSELVGDFANFIGKFPEFVKVAFERKNIDVKKLDTEDFITRLYNSNLRALLDDAVAVYIYVYSYLRCCKETIFGVSEYLSSSFRLVTEALFRKGKFYSPSYKDKLYVPPYSDVTFPNLLNITLRGEPKPPLMTIFLLYFLLVNRKSGTHKTTNYIASVLRREFKKDWISDEYVRGNLLRPLWECGYVKLGDNDDCWYITDKGEWILLYTFRDINAFSSLCYNGVIRKKYHRLLVKYTDLGGNLGDGNPWKEYLSVTLRNSVVLLAFLQEEIQYLEDEYSYHLESLIFNEELKKDFEEFLIFYLGKLETNWIMETIEVDLRNFGDSGDEIIRRVEGILDKLTKDSKDLIEKLQRIKREDLLTLSRKAFDALKFEEKLSLLKWLMKYRPGEVVPEYKDPSLLADDYISHVFLFGNFEESELQKRRSAIVNNYSKANYHPKELINKISKFLGGENG
ncbi:hypothetical protein [Phorcysia thermohydrogeniphila]|uniref:Uncharacterized protein n=1 Tax=Phorcysia thermohydrogeniphila TaxID=936138 RepID=A0A4R1GAV8_9BACT|nr:hypothetical protein [Phorcysia thermohydrogeniphila]TCK05377.1 hypothetical protein CLV27_0804 [Phorcysia thermohydrogeniphila]